MEEWLEREEEGGDEKEMWERGWRVAGEAYKNMGYKEAVVVARDAHLQLGFDRGFHHAASLAYFWGQLHGIFSYEHYCNFTGNKNIMNKWKMETLISVGEDYAKMLTFYLL